MLEEVQVREAMKAICCKILTTHCRLTRAGGLKFIGAALTVGTSVGATVGMSVVSTGGSSAAGSLWLSGVSPGTEGVSGI